MADYKVTDTELTSIANAIRTKGGTQAQLEFPAGFVSAVQAIPSGGGNIQPLSVTQNGTYTPPSGVDGYSPVTVNVSGGGIVVNLLDEYQVEWWNKSSDAAAGESQEVGIIEGAGGGLAIYTTKTPIDFTGKSKIKVNVLASSGQYNTMSRVAVSGNPITNDNRGNVYTQFLNGPGEYELVLPEQKTALYVAIETWTGSVSVVPLVIAE